MRKTIRGILSLVLALAMALSLAACGNQSSGGDTPGSSGSSGGKTEPTETPEYAYLGSYFPIKAGEDAQNILPRAYTKDGFYGTVYTKIGEMPSEEPAEYEGQYDIYGNKLYFVSYDGTLRELKAYVPMEGLENPDNYSSFTSGSDLSGVLLDADGGLILLESVYANWYDGPESAKESGEAWQYYKNQNNYYLRRVDAEGAEQSCVLLDFQPEESSWLNLGQGQLDERGNLLCTSEKTVIAFAPDGSVAYTLEADDWIDSLVRLGNGKLCVSSWGDRGMVLLPIDAENGKLGEPVSPPEMAYNFITGNEEYDLFYTNGSYLYGYKLDTQETEKILNWVECDVNGDRINGLHVNEDGSITGVYSTWENDTSSSELVRLEKVPYDQIPQKSHITLASLYGGEVRDQIIEFNRHNDTVHIDLLDYSEFNDYENGDYNAGRTKLLTEIMAGKVPDLLPLGELPYTQLAAKGLLEDLYPYIDGDKELSREDFFPNILKAMEVDGKLCEVCSGFQVSTLIGAASVVGDTPGWNYDQFRVALAGMPEGCDPLDPYVVRDDILQTLLYLEMDHFVDWTTGKCSFDSQDFVDLLNFAAMFPESYDWDHYEYSEEDSTENRIKTGRQMLTQSGISSFDDLQYNEMYFGGPVTYIGYPTNHGTGHVLNLSTCYAMSATCQNKDAAWQFLRNFLSEDYQLKQWGLPFNQKAYQAKLKEAMTPEYEKDPDGNYILDENGNKVEVSRGGWSTGDGEIHNIYALSQEQADMLRTVIDSLESAADFNTAVFEIVKEQAQAFFAGQKTAEDVARLIQSKANIYVNEQR